MSIYSAPALTLALSCFITSLRRVARGGHWVLSTRTEVGMVAVALMLFATVVFVNAFFLLGRVEGRAAGPINLIGGVLGVLIAYFIFASDPKGGATFAAVLVGSFAVLFLMVGAVLTWGFDASAPGYYSILGAVISLLFAFTVMGADARLGFIALSYAALFVLFAAPFWPSADRSRSSPATSHWRWCSGA